MPPLPAAPIAIVYVVDGVSPVMYRIPPPPAPPPEADAPAAANPPPPPPPPTAVNLNLVRVDMLFAVVKVVPEVIN
jgi:hypothetical protein